MFSNVRDARLAEEPPDVKQSFTLYQGLPVRRIGGLVSSIRARRLR
jgi:hypothetical protein